MHKRLFATGKNTDKFSMTNSFNIVINKLTQSNIDIKYLLFGYAMLNYVTKYVTKNEYKSNMFEKFN